MRRRQTYAALLLCVAVSCSSFQTQRVRQAALTIDELAAQATILNENERISIETAKAVSATLKVALAEVERWWASYQAGAPRETRTRIFQIITDSLAEATALLAEREQ